MSHNEMKIRDGLKQTVFACVLVFLCFLHTYDPKGKNHQVHDVLSRSVQQCVPWLCDCASGTDCHIICPVSPNGNTFAFEETVKVSECRCLCLRVCVCRDAERTSEERTSITGGSLLRPEHHGGGQATPDKGRIHTHTSNTWACRCACFGLGFVMFTAVLVCAFASQI